jgi:hypothetical protein
MIKYIQKTIGEYLNDLSDDKIRTVQELGKPSQLIEGIDFQINHRGAWIFSAWYLLRQGKCCGNGCTHCPYPTHLKKSQSSSKFNN